MQRYLWIILLLLFGFLFSYHLYAYDDGDFQVWNTDTEELKINKSSKIALEEELRFGENASELYYQHYDIGFTYSLNKSLNLGTGYRHILERKKSKFKEENAPYGFVSLLWEIRGFKFEDRNRLEYRAYDYQTDTWRYRNKISVKFPWKFTALEIQPYISDEIYVHLNGINLNQNRLSAGLGFNITKKIKGEIYYLLMTAKASGTCTWTDANVLGTKLKISF
jgi:hypothetical protein